jgi:integrase
MSTGPPIPPPRHNGRRRDERRGVESDAIDRVVRKYALALGLDRGCSAHSMRATSTTTALENCAQLEDVQKAAGHLDSGTTKLYDRRAIAEKRQQVSLRHSVWFPTGATGNEGNTNADTWGWAAGT